MRILVISDIHANCTALEAVLADAGQVDATWCLGDLVGYGPDPEACLEIIRKIPDLTCIKGNHDAASLDSTSLAIFNSDARRSLTWTRGQLSQRSLDYLRSLPEVLVERGEVSLVHGSPRDPIWEYILNTVTARFNFSAFSTPWCFVGHSHLQCIFERDDKKDIVDLVVAPPGKPYDLTNRAILNPGSVGQPRDRNPLAAYAIYRPKNHSWEPRRVAYDIPAVQERIRAAGLPEKHAARLAEGW
jgi:predicted phosphodiesterase